MLDKSRQLGLVWDCSTPSALLAPDCEAVPSNPPMSRARRAREQLGRPLKTAGLMLSRGDILGRYEIEDMIGIGGMAIVYRAKQLTLNRSVALKLLAAELTSDDFQERFRREGKLAASLDHPNIVPVYDADESEGRLFIAMRLVEGETLADRVRQGGAIPPSKTLSLLKPIASALDAAHDAGLVHRDVKPQNILLGRRDHPYLADFGIAKGDASSTSLTSAGAFVGTVNYASPEQILGYELTGRTDVYALTAVLYECLAGRVPFLRDTDVAVLHAHLHDQPPGLPDSGDGSLETVNAVIARGLAKDPADRFRSAGELLEAAELALADTTRSSPAGPTGVAHKGNGATRPSPVRSGRLLDAAARTITGLPAEALHTRAAETAQASAAPKQVDVPAAPPRWRSRRRFRRRRALAAVSVAALGGALALLLVPHGGGNDLKTAQAGLVSLHYPAHWRRAQAQAQPPDGVRLTSEADLSGPGGALLRAGRISAPAAAAAGLPHELSRNAAGTPSASATTLDSAHGRLYTGTLKSGESFAAYVFAGSAGDVALMCEGATPDVVAGCAQVVNDSRIGGTVLPAEPDATVAAALRKAMSPLAKARGAVGSDMASSDLTTRAGGAASVAGADRVASKEIVKIKAGPRRAQALQNLATALTAEAGQLDRLGNAIHSRDRTAYRNARSGVRKAEASMKRSLSSLKVAGYGTQSARLPALSLNPLIASSVPPAKKAPSSSGGSTTGSSSSSTSTPSYQSGGGGTGSSGTSGTRSTPRKNSGGNTIPVTPGHYDGP
jgi:predicted Ser/Thr protein kinase